MKPTNMFQHRAPNCSQYLTKISLGILNEVGSNIYMHLYRTIYVLLTESFNDYPNRNSLV